MPVCEAQTYYVYLSPLDSLNAATPYEDGRFVKLSNGPDTMTVWLEHLRRGEEPSRHAALRADSVLWCYPKRYKHPKHLTPGREGQLAVYFTKRQLMITEVGSEVWHHLREHAPHVYEGYDP